MHKLLLRSFTMGIFILGTLPLSAEVINFSSLSTPGSFLNDEGPSYTQDGFTFTSSQRLLATWEASSSNLPSLNIADTSLFEYYAGSATTLTDGAGTFTLSSIDLAPLLAGNTGTFDVWFTGTHPDLSTVTAMFTVSDSTPSVLTTFDFSGFTNLQSVSFTQGTNSGFFVTQETAYQFDNVVVTASPTGVPEPGSFILLLAVIAAVGPVVEKKRRSSQAIGS